MRVRAGSSTLSISALIRELDRNPALLQACGFNVLPVQGKPRVQRAPKEGDPGKPVTAHEAPAAPRRAVPTDWSFSRFLSNFHEEESLHPRSLKTWGIFIRV